MLAAYPARQCDGADLHAKVMGVQLLPLTKSVEMRFDGKGNNGRRIVGKVLLDIDGGHCHKQYHTL